MVKLKWILTIAIAAATLMPTNEVSANSPGEWKHKRVLKGGKIKKFKSSAAIWNDRGSKFHPSMNSTGRKRGKESQKFLRSQFPIH